MIRSLFYAYMGQLINVGGSIVWGGEYTTLSAHAGPKYCSWSPGQAGAQEFAKIEKMIHDKFCELKAKPQISSKIQLDPATVQKLEHFVTSGIKALAAQRVRANKAFETPGQVTGQQAQFTSATQTSTSQTGVQHATTSTATENQTKVSKHVEPSIILADNVKLDDSLELSLDMTQRLQIHWSMS